MTVYRAMVSPASDPGGFVAELPFTTLTITDTLNSPSSCALSLPIELPNSDVTLKTDGSGSLEPGKTLLWVERDGALIFGGPIWSATADIGAGTVSLNAGGFHSYLRRRVIRTTQTFSAVDQWDIARQLVDYAEGVTDSLGVITTPQIANSGTTRDRTYPAHERKNVAEALEQLAAVNGGFDFRFDLVYSSGVPEAQLFCFDSAGYASGLVLDLEANVQAVLVAKDGASLANQVDAFGEGEGPERLLQTSTQSSPGYPLLQAVVNHPDVSVTSTLTAHAERTRATLQKPVTTAQIAMAPGDRTAVSARVGDLVTVRASTGIVDLDGSFKITSRTISVAGGENVTLFAADADAFATV